MSLTNPSIPHPPPPPPPHPTDPPTINVLVILVPTLPYMIFDLAELQSRRSGHLFANSVVVHQNYSYLWITHSSWLCLLHPRPWQSVRSPLLPCILFFPLLVPREIQIGSYFAVWLELQVQPLGLSLSSLRSFAVSWFVSSSPEMSDVFLILIVSGVSSVKILL